MAKLDLQLAHALTKAIRDFTKSSPGSDSWCNLLDFERGEVFEKDSSKIYPTTKLGQLLIMHLQSVLGVGWFDPTSMSRSEILELVEEAERFCGLIEEKIKFISS